MGNSADSCESTGATSNKLSRLVIAVNEPLDPSLGVTNEAFNSLVDIFDEQGIAMSGAHRISITSAVSVHLVGNIPDGFEEDLTSNFDLVFAGTGPVHFLPIILPLDDEASTLDETKVIKVEDFVRVINDTLSMMTGIETDEDDS